MTDDSNLKLFQKPQRQETYKAQMCCGNCWNQFATQVPKGTLAINVSWVCPNCGCSKEQIEEESKRQQAGIPVARPY